MYGQFKHRSHRGVCLVARAEQPRCAAQTIPFELPSTNIRTKAEGMIALSQGQIGVFAAVSHR